MKAPDLFVKCLEREGIEYVFGVTGEENAGFVYSLKDSDIKFVLTRHEQGAAIMAEAYGKVHRQSCDLPGHAGAPGATNLITGVADANMDHAPLIVLTGQGATTRQHKENAQCSLTKVRRILSGRRVQLQQALGRRLQWLDRSRR